MAQRDPRLHLRIFSRFEEIDLVDSVALSVLAHFGMAGDELDHTVLAVREAVANAVEHGAGGDESRPIEVSFRREASSVLIEVEDLGRGFDPDSVANPLAPENLLKPKGRGIFLMRSFMDDVHFSFSFREAGRGTRVTLRKGLREEERRGPVE